MTAPNFAPARLVSNVQAVAPSIENVNSCTQGMSAASKRCRTRVPLVTQLRRTSCSCNCPVRQFQRSSLAKVGSPRPTMLTTEI